MILFATPGYSITPQPRLISGSLRIINVSPPPDFIVTNEYFDLDITIQKLKIRPINYTIEVYLLDGILGTKIRTIGKITSTMILSYLKPFKNTVSCFIRDEDVQQYLESYDIQVAIFWNRNCLHRSILQDYSTLQGIHIKSEFLEKNKVSIVTMSVPQNLSAKVTTFNTTINVSNKGFFNVSAWVCVYLIQKPSAIPQLEGIIDISTLTSEKIELGKNKSKLISSNTTENFTVNCSIRETEQDKNEFFIQAEVYVRIDGIDYIVDTSSYYGILQNQPPPDNTYMNIIIIIVALFSGLIAVALVAVIVRILYPLYKIKKVKLKKEREKIERKVK